jgi:hypothetical protein
MGRIAKAGQSPFATLFSRRAVRARTPIASQPLKPLFLLCVMLGFTLSCAARYLLRINDEAMQVSSSGSTNLHALVMFVLDADRPFSAPAVLPCAPREDDMGWYSVA